MTELGWVWYVALGLWSLYCLLSAGRRAERQLFRSVRRNQNEMLVLYRDGQTYVLMTRAAAERLGWNFQGVEGQPGNRIITVGIPSTKTADAN